MALTQFCQTLQQYAEKLEEEIKYNINEFHNIIFGKKLDETKLALERAKDYHLTEIADAAREILKNVKIIVFHQDKIDWLSNESNFTANDLKRFSYVKRQVYAFSKPEEKHALSRSEENLAAVPYTVKRENRRRASEISIGSLEDWEKYLDQKDKDESQINENIVEVKKMVPKRTLSNARARKKFVSSTLGGFLDDDGRKRRNLESIIETTSLTDDVEENESKDDEYESNITIEEKTDITQEFLPKDNYFKTDTKNSGDKVETNSTGTVNNTESKPSENVANDSTIIVPKPDESAGSDSTGITDSQQESVLPPEETNFTVNKEEYSDLVDSINNSMASQDDLINEIMNTFFDEKTDVASPATQVSGCQFIEKDKPKIVDVIYKKKPT